MGYSEYFLISLPNDWNRYIYGYISRLIWTMPFLLLIERDKHECAIPSKKILEFHFHWKSFLTVLVLSTIYVLCRMFSLHGGWWINPNIIFLQVLSKFGVVGFVEELVYRGFGLNMLSKYMSGRKANVISSLFFAAVHLPSYFIHWYCDSMFSLTAMLIQAISAFVFGLIFGVMFRKSKSIWPPTIIHFGYDFSYIVFIG